MAKRFTDTAKWRKPWYRKLGSKGRDVFNWLYDNCEASGVWEIDFEKMTFELGFSCSMASIPAQMNAREIGDNKLFFPGFIEFQCGELKEGCKPHDSIINRLKKLTLWEPYQKGLLTLQDKEKEKDKDSSFEKGSGGKLFKPDLAAIYKLYPRKEGKSKGLSILVASIKTPADEQDCLKALAAFLAHHKRKGTESDFFPHFKTWAGHWRDCLDPDYGESESFATTKEFNWDKVFEEPGGAA